MYIKVFRGGVHGFTRWQKGSLAQKGLGTCALEPEVSDSAGITLSHNLTPLCLSWFIYKMGIVIVPMTCDAQRVKCDESLSTLPAVQ